jgi:isochorismate synthase
LSLNKPFSMSVVLDTPSQLNTFLDRGVRLARRSGYPVLVSLAEPCPAFDPITVFEQGQTLTPHLHLWSQPGAGFHLVGLGIARAIESVEAAQFRQAAQAWRRLLAGAIREGPRRLPGVGPLLLGGFAFDRDREPTRLWEGFPAGQLILPKLLFSQVEGEQWLTFNVIVTPTSDPLADIALLRSWRALLTGLLNAPRLSRPPASFMQHELRPAAEWRADVAEAAHTIRAGDLEKVVLARAVQLRAQRPFEAPRALRQLAQDYTGCYLFAIQRGEQCFLGATPEQLVRLRDNALQTMALAGSIRRGDTPDEDDDMARELLASVKDRNEHTIVVQAVVEALGEACPNPHYADTPQLLTLGNIHHLCTPITGELAHGYTLLDLVERLHPTPAVGGRPREAALELIRTHEKLDRGWYAGPVGWLDANGEGEFAVALRSALLAGRAATLFAGCGIMADSEPEREYAEADLKLKPMLRALTGQ